MGAPVEPWLFENIEQRQLIDRRHTFSRSGERADYVFGDSFQAIDGVVEVIERQFLRATDVIRSRDWDSQRRSELFMHSANFYEICHEDVLREWRGKRRLLGRR